MKKSKWDIIGSDIDREIDFVYEDWFCYWYDGEDYFDYGYGVDYEYDYIGTIYKDYVSKRGIRVTFERFNMGSYIDMMSIYPKEVLRDMKIDYLLGKDHNNRIPTLADIKINKLNYEN